MTFLLRPALDVVEICLHRPAVDLWVSEPRSISFQREC